MSLRIQSVRLSNFRSFECSELNVSTVSSILIGANNVGKTSFFNALRLVFDLNYKPSAEDIFRKTDEDLSTLHEKSVFVDVLLSPFNSPDPEDNYMFSEVWADHFGEHTTLDTVDDNDVQYVPLRAIISYDSSKDDYRVERKSLQQWPIIDDFLSYRNYKSTLVTNRLFESLPVFYMDARRDIVVDMKDRFSYFAKLVKDIKIDSSQIDIFEDALSKINKDLVDGSEVLKHLTHNLSKISTTMNRDDSKIMINPITQKVRDLGKNLEITFKDENSDVFPISNHGMGTRSWITFLTVLSYVEWQIKLKKESSIAYHPIILLEEPEAHLHPNSQRNIYNQIKSLQGQIFVSTHSPIVVSQSELHEMIYISKQDGNSKLKSMEFQITPEDYTKLKFEILRSRGELLFSEGIILCEGQTEEQSLPEFFKEKFKMQPYECGYNVVSVGGSGNKYLPFLLLAKWFDIPAFIFSDGETKAERELTNLLSQIFDTPEDISAQLEKILFLPNKNNFEKYLIEDGYGHDLIESIENSLEEENAFDKFIVKNHKQLGRPSRTAEKCDTCNQNIFKRHPINYDGDVGRINALIDFSKKHKTLYSSVIAKVIISNNQGTERVIPTEINKFLDKISF